MMILKLLNRVYCLAPMLVGCAGIPARDLTTVTVQERQVQLVLTRHSAAPTVVFENGLGGTVHHWAKVQPAIASEYTTFIYNRPGYGSSASSSTPRDGEHVVDELREVLRSQELAPPYVLVGHSLGGLYLQWYARRYPEEVAGLVLVDSTHPEQMRGAGDPANWPWWLKLVMQCLTNDAAKAELDAVNRTGQEVLAMPPPRGMPIILLSAQKPMRIKSTLADDANRKREELLDLYPSAKRIWVDSGHGIPWENPQAVIDAIQEVIAESRTAVAKQDPPSNDDHPQDDHHSPRD